MKKLIPSLLILLLLSSNASLAVEQNATILPRPLDEYLLKKLQEIGMDGKSIFLRFNTKRIQYSDSNNPENDKNDSQRNSAYLGYLADLSDWRLIPFNGEDCLKTLLPLASAEKETDRPRPRNFVDLTDPCYPVTKTTNSLGNTGWYVEGDQNSSNSLNLNQGPDDRAAGNGGSSGGIGVTNPTGTAMEIDRSER